MKKETLNKFKSFDWNSFNKDLEKQSKEMRKLRKIKCPICKKLIGNWQDLDDDDEYMLCPKCKIRIYEW